MVVVKDGCSINKVSQQVMNWAYATVFEDEKWGAGFWGAARAFGGINTVELIGYRWGVGERHCLACARSGAGTNWGI